MTLRLAGLGDNPFEEVNLLEEKHLKYVRTQEGAERYGKPIGSLVVSGDGDRNHDGKHGGTHEYIGVRPPHAKFKISAVTDDSVTVKTDDGQKFSVKLDDGKLSVLDHDGKQIAGGFDNLMDAYVHINKKVKTPSTPAKKTSSSSTESSSSDRGFRTGKDDKGRKVWITPDGQEWLSAEDASKHATRNKITVAKDGNGRKVWKTYDGQEWLSEEDARNHIKKKSEKKALSGLDIETKTLRGLDDEESWF